MLTSAGEGHPGFGRSASTEVKRFDTCSRSKSTSNAAPSFRHVAGAIAWRLESRFGCCRIGQLESGFD